MYVPVYYILLSSKCEDTYNLALTMANLATNWELNADTIVSDCEMSLTNAIQTLFPEAQLILCRFHVKQTWRKQCIKLNISQDVITAFLGPDGIINILFIIPTSEFTKGIAYIRARFDEGNSRLF